MGSISYSLLCLRLLEIVISSITPDLFIKFIFPVVFVLSSITFWRTILKPQGWSWEAISVETSSYISYATANKYKLAMHSDKQVQYLFCRPPGLYNAATAGRVR